MALDLQVPIEILPVGLTSDNVNTVCLTGYRAGLSPAFATAASVTYEFEVAAC